MRELKGSLWMIIGIAIAMLVIPALSFGADATAVSGAGAVSTSNPTVTSNPVSTLSTSQSMGLTQISTPVDPSTGRQLPDATLITLPSPLQWFGPYLPTWTSGIDFGGKQVFTLAELKHFGTCWSTTIEIDLFKDSNLIFDSIKLIVLEPVAKDGKLYVPKVNIQGNGEVVGTVDGIATSTGVSLKKLIVEAMLKAANAGANHLIVYNHSNEFDATGWSIGVGGGGSISQLYGDEKQRGLQGSMSGGTYYGKTRANAYPWFNAIAVKIGTAKVSALQTIEPKVGPPVISDQDRAKANDFSMIETGTYKPR